MMASLTHHDSNLLSEHQNRPESTAPSIVVTDPSGHDEWVVNATQLEKLRSSAAARQLAHQVLKSSNLDPLESPSLESITDNSGHSMSSSLSELSSNDGNASYEKVYLGYFIISPGDAERSYEQSFVPRHEMPNNRAFPDAQANMNTFEPSCHDGPFDTRSPSEAARISPFVAANGPFGSDPPTSSYAVNVPLHYLRSPNDPLGDPGDRKDQKLHDPHFYLNFTDDFREPLNKGDAFYSAELDMMASVLEHIIEREVLGKLVMPFSTIVFSRLEKLLQSLIDYPRRSRNGSEPNFKAIVHMALEIQRLWQTRLQGHMFTIDEQRVKYMLKQGRLANVKLQPSPKGDGSVEWTAAMQLPGAGTDLLNYQVGLWWLNAACAFRDGIVNLTGDKKTGTHQLVTYVTLLKGVETFDPQSECMIYELEGRLEEVLLHLHDKVGKSIRLLRGYKLKSGNAPRIGIRYDGIHILRRYSLKCLSTNKSLYRVMLHYDAVKGESGADKDFPKPSGRDDWELYKKIERMEMRKWYSEERYRAWKAGEDHEVKDCQEWHRQERFREQAKKLNY